nr:MAG TPA: hypothetical protein [Caudoviricetes sp.]
MQVFLYTLFFCFIRISHYPMFASKVITSNTLQISNLRFQSSDFVTFC